MALCSAAAARDSTSASSRVEESAAASALARLSSASGTVTSSLPTEADGERGASGGTSFPSDVRRFSKGEPAARAKGDVAALIAACHAPPSSLHRPPSGRFARKRRESEREREVCEG
eukprot:scaffold253053_cov21-Tisochrysis_lutea.AAC.1